MAEISKIQIPNGASYDIWDSQVPKLTDSVNTYLRGDGEWAVPTINYQNGVTFVDGGDHLLVCKIT